MIKWQAVCSVLAVVLPLAAQASPRIIQEKQLQFHVENDPSADSVQTFTGFYALDQVSKIPHFADPYQISKEQAGIRKYVLAHSAFYLNMSLDEARQRTENPVDLAHYSKHFVVSSCVSSVCQGEISTTFSSNKVTFKNVIAERGDDDWASVMAGMQNPDFIEIQEYTQIEQVFSKGSNITAFYKVGANRTLVQNYELFSANESAYEKASHIPFFNLDHAIQSVISDLTVDGRSSILHENEDESN